MSAWEEIVDYTVPSNTTSVTLDNFGTITKDDFIKITATIVNPTATGAEYHIYGNTTNGVSGYNSPSNYVRQVLNANGSSISANRGTTFRLIFNNSNQTSYSNIYSKISEDNTLNFFNNNTRELNTAINTGFSYVTTTITFPDPITTFEIESNTTNALGANSRIQIYRLAAQKVADITVNSNTTQVDITGLDIKKSDEYLLVSDISDNSSGHVNLVSNDLTTFTDYYHQVIFGSGATAGADRRQSQPFIANTNSISYQHIKISNTGAFTFQSYELRNSGTTTPSVVNFFVSSTYENLTNINKLNLISQNSNGIGNGTRFQLYKLYEGGN